MGLTNYAKIIFGVGATKVPGFLIPALVGEFGNQFNQDDVDVLEDGADKYGAYINTLAQNKENGDVQYIILNAEPLIKR